MKILNWEKYQGRKVKERTAWLRLQNDFIENPNFSEFSSDERLVWVYALCCSSKLNRSSIHVPDQCSHRVLNRCTGIDEKTFHRTFEKLKKLQIVELRTSRGCYADDTSANADVTLRNETLRDVDETLRNTLAQAPASLSFDFEVLYKKYPRRLGKQRGLQLCKSQIKSEADYQALSIAIDRYRGFIQAQATEEKFIKHFSTFMGSWRDWLDPATGTADAPKRRGIEELLADEGKVPA